jgi:hypothetical protein
MEKINIRENINELRRKVWNLQEKSKNIIESL